jgi:hypothetical protein
MNRMNEDDVADFIQNNPEFFRRKPWLLGSIELPDPHDGQAVSLAERQTQILRERIRSLETRLAELVNHGHDNDALSDGLARWSAALLAERDEACLPPRIVDGLKDVFGIPTAAIRAWELAPRFAGLECAQAVGSDVMRFAASMRAPFCGLNADFEVAGWMRENTHEIRSLALIPMRSQAGAAPFGLLTLGSPDPLRFRSDMGTTFLARIGELAAAALCRLRA